jgi:glycolate oxidase iron-sulfur subunit
VQEAFLPHVNTASIELLQRLGLDVEIPSRQTCCGAAQIHSGDLKTARWLARQNVDAFQENDCLAVITNAGGCAATLAEEYSRLLEDDPGYRWKARRFSAKIKEIHQFVTELGTFSPSRPFDAVVAYSDSCHLRNVLRVTEPPRDLLRRIPGVRLAPLKGDYCCGSAGIYNLVQPETADRLLALKIRSIAESNADVVAVGNTGCHLQILRGVREAGLKCRVLHSVEILNLACGGVAPGFDSKADQAAGTTGGSNGR